MKKIYYLLLLQLMVSLTYAQKQDYVWLFGQNKEYYGTDTAYRFDFKVKSFEIVKAGLYILKIMAGDESVFTEKIVINKG